MDRYSEYKDSGIEWIGEIPRHWSISSLKYSLKLIMGQSPNAVALNDEGEGIPFLQGCKEFGKRYPSPVQFISSPLKICNQDSILLSVRAPVGRLNYSDRNYCIGRGLCALSAIDNISHIKFAQYLMEILTSELERVSSGSTYTAVTVSDIKTLSYIAVPIHEQIQISQFLDEKISQFDSLIQKLERKIELLTEYRTALISQCVTKGLDPDAEMKDSGIEWIGEIPRHWSNLRLKYATTYNDEVLSESTDPEFEFRYIEIGDVDQFSGVGIGKRISFAKSPSRARRILRVNDVLISTVRTYLRAIGTIPETEDNFVGSTGFCVLRATSHIIWSYLSNFVKTEYFVSALVANSQGVTYPAITPTDLVKLRMLLPPIKEQIQISQHLDQKTTQIDALIEKLQQKIELHKECRQSLISNVVTGKVRVPELVA